jgi:integrase
MLMERFRYVHRIVDRSAKARHYLRLGRKKFPIAGEFGSPEFRSNYEALLNLHFHARCNSRRPIGPKGARPFGANVEDLVAGSIDWIIVKYLASDQFGNLSASTRRVYRRAFDLMRSTIGKRIIRKLDVDDVALYCAKIARERAASTADLHLGLISTIWKFSRGFPECRRKGQQNPTIGAERLYKVSKPHEPWPLSLQLRFLDAASPSLRLAFYLLLYTGQRRGDVIAMKWSDYDGEKLRIWQEKTSEEISIYVHKNLRDLLASIKPVHEQILTSKFKRPFSRQGLTFAVKATLRKIGAPSYTLHGLRKTTAVTLAELGRSEFEIMAVLGHKSPKMAAYYCRKANKSRLNHNAIRAWEMAGD